MADTEERAVLKGQDAVKLWRKGADAWNAWVAKNPVADIDFSSVNFSNHEAVPFRNFQFPNGSIDFTKAYFGDGDVIFANSIFGNCDVSFRGARFGRGAFIFEHVQFGKGDVSFEGANFGEGLVGFENVGFCSGNVSFKEALFGTGIIAFEEIIFGEGRFEFDDADLGHGKVMFSKIDFGNGLTSFQNVKWGEGDIFFHEIKFGFGNVKFRSSIFEKNNLTFFKTSFKCEKIQYSYMKADSIDLNFTEVDFGSAIIFFSFSILKESELTILNSQFESNNIHFQNNIIGSFYMRNCLNTESISELPFRAMRLAGTFVLEGNFTCVPDLRSTVMAAHVDLETSFIDPPRYKRQFPAFTFPRPAARHAAPLRRLKELAEQNRHHEAALRFFALERRDMRWTTSLSAWASALDWFYDVACVYGQSVMRPAAILVGLFAVFANVYGLLDPGLGAWGALVKSAYYTVPFVFIKSAQPAAAVFTDPVHALTMAQQGFSFIFLFLLGVSLRNRFRL